jgi:hypothetical protein
VHNEEEKMQKESVVAKYEALDLHIPGRTEEKHIEDSKVGLSGRDSGRKYVSKWLSWLVSFLFVYLAAVFQSRS